MPRLRPHQAGAASLVVLMLMLGVSVLLAAWSQRHVLTELRTAAAREQRAVAHEAAEAGLGWSQAMLNQGRAIDGACQPVSDPSTNSFLARYLSPPASDGQVTPRSRASGGGSLALQVLCAQRAGAWDCHCPTNTAAGLAPSGSAAQPSFLLTFAPSTMADVVDVMATGCSHLAQPCLAGSAERAAAVVRLRVTLARLPALATPPGAALTTRGDVDAGSAALGLHNADARSGGLAVQAGGRLLASALRVHTAPGAPAAGALLVGDAALAGSSTEAFFARHFGIDRAEWLRQPGVRSIDCRAGNCSARLRDLIEEQSDLARIAVAGPLRLDGPLQLGSADKPVLLSVDGALELRGAVVLHALVHATRLQWDGVAEGGGGLLKGAALLDQGYAGDGAPDLVYDAGLVRLLQRQAGTWVRVPGSWRDF